MAKFAKGNPGKQKGSVCKVTRSAKEAIALAAEGLGGTDLLIAWVKEDALNERVFWGNIYPKLLPLQVSGDQQNPLSVIHKIERLIIDTKA